MNGLECLVACKIYEFLQEVSGPYTIDEIANGINLSNEKASEVAESLWRLGFIQGEAIDHQFFFWVEESVQDFSVIKPEQMAFGG